MIHSAALKLTFWYLSIIMALSIAFSFAIYHISDNELNQTAGRQSNFFRREFGPNSFNYDDMRHQQIVESEHHLLNNLLLLNVITLIFGGAASYGLARRTLKPIESAMEAQSRFASDASHELRTPLTAMQTENEVALRNPDLTKAQARSQLESNLEEIANLKALSEGLLRLARQDNESLSTQKASLKAMTDKAIERVQKIASQKNIKIEASIKDALVRGDEQSLSEMLVVLLDNAVKYSEPNSTIQLSAAPKGHSAVITVKDSGAGIHAKDMPHIFDRFYRADSSRSKATNGYGLGLAIAKKIADAHQGTIEVSSAPKRGATFIVNLPLAG